MPAQVVRPNIPQSTAGIGAGSHRPDRGAKRGHPREVPPADERANQDFTDFLAGAQNDIADKQAAALKTLADAAAKPRNKPPTPSSAEQDGFINNWSQIGSTAFIDGLNAANFDVFFNNFRTNIMKSVLEGTVAGLFKCIAEDRLRPLAEAYRQALLTPGTADDLAVLNDLRNGITQLSGDLKPAFDALSPAFADLKSELKANTAATQENTQATREQEFGTTIASFAPVQPTPGLSLRNMFRSRRPDALYLQPPWAVPYLTVYARESQYAQGEIAPLGGTFETLRGEFCGQATLKFSAPPPFLAGTGSASTWTATRRTTPRTSGR